MSHQHKTEYRKILGDQNQKRKFQILAEKKKIKTETTSPILQKTK